MTTYARRRLLRDFKKISHDPPHGVSGAPMNQNIMHWQAVIFGPDDSPWEGGTFHLEMSFNEEYPNKPPDVRFVTKIFHPNVYNNGRICLDILQNQWSPVYDVSAVLMSIQSLLCDPNPQSPANLEAAQLYAENRREYNKRVQMCVEASWEEDHLDEEEKETGEGGAAGQGTQSDTSREVASSQETSNAPQDYSSPSDLSASTIPPVAPPVPASPCPPLSQATDGGAT